MIASEDWDDNNFVVGIPFSASCFQSVLDKRFAIGREYEISILEESYIQDFFLLKEGLLLGCTAKRSINDRVCVAVSPING